MGEENRLPTEGGRWARGLELLRSFTSASSSAPSSPPDPYLAKWMGRQRYQRRLQRSGMRSHMSDARAALLLEAGLDVDVPPAREEAGGEGEGSGAPPHPHPGTASRLRDARWDARLAELVEWRDRNGGSCSVPYGQGALGRWTSKQKHELGRYEGGCRAGQKMTAYRSRKLREVGLTAAPASAPSSATASSLPPSSSASSSRPPASSSSAPAPPPAPVAFSGGRTQAAKWRERLTQLGAYRARHGHCNVPYDHADHGLAKWVERQRYWHRLLREGRRSQMTEARAADLGELGFVWALREGGSGVARERRAAKAKAKAAVEAGEAGATPSSGGGGITSPPSSNGDRWEVRYRELEEYKKRHGHASVPSAYAANAPLAKWVERQRSEMRLRSEGKPSQITDARLGRLGALGLSFRRQGTAWTERLEALRSFRASNGHCLVPSDHPADPQLSKWVQKQRAQMKRRQEGGKSQLTEERVAQLEAIGFCFSVLDAKWDERLRDLRRYCRTWRDDFATIARKSPGLGKWLYKQKREYQLKVAGRPSSLTDRREQELRDLGFDLGPGGLGSSRRALARQRSRLEGGEVYV